MMVTIQDTPLGNNSGNYRGNVPGNTGNIPRNALSRHPACPRHLRAGIMRDRRKSSEGHGRISETRPQAAEDAQKNASWYGEPAAALRSLSLPEERRRGPRQAVALSFYGTS